MQSYFDYRKTHDTLILLMSALGIGLIVTLLTVNRDFEIWIGEVFLVPSLLFLITILFVLWSFRLTGRASYAGEPGPLRARLARVETLVQLFFVLALIAAVAAGMLAFYYAPADDSNYETIRFRAGPVLADREAGAFRSLHFARRG